MDITKQTKSLACNERLKYNTKNKTIEVKSVYKITIALKYMKQNGLIKDKEREREREKDAE